MYSYITAMYTHKTFQITIKTHQNRLTNFEVDDTMELIKIGKNVEKLKIRLKENVDTL